jgi:hypothetical protein
VAAEAASIYHKPDTEVLTPIDSNSTAQAWHGRVNMGITLFGVAGILFMVGGFILGNGFVLVAGSIMLSSAFIANQIAAR